MGLAVAEVVAPCCEPSSLRKADMLADEEGLDAVSESEPFNGASTGRTAPLPATSRKRLPPCCRATRRQVEGMCLAQ